MEKARGIIINIIVFSVGLFIGLVILGWGLMPVTWTGGNLDHVSQEIRTDYLRMAIDSYTLYNDAQMATERYYALGEAKEYTLSQVYLDPAYQDQASINSFAQAVGAADVVSSTTPVPPPDSTAVDTVGMIIMRPLLAALCVLLILFALGALAIFLIIRRMRKKEAVQSPDLAPEPIGDTVELPTQVLESETQPEAALPDWADQPDETVKLADQSDSLGIEEPSEQEGGYPPDQAAAQEYFTFEQPAKEEDQSSTNYAAMGAIAGAGLGALAYAGTREDEIEEQELGGETEGSSTEPLDPDSLFEISDPADSDILSENTGLEELLLVSSAAFDTGEPVQAAENDTEQDIDESQGVEAVLSGEEVTEETKSEEALTEEAQPEEETPEQTMARFSRNLQYVEGIGPAYAQKLQDAGIQTPAALLKKGNSAKGRQQIAEETGISPTLILTWVNHIDLYRVKGIGSEYADLLEAAGVDTVVELGKRNPENLYRKLIEVNEQKKLVRLVPALSMVTRWVDSAKRLPRVVTY